MSLSLPSPGILDVWGGQLNAWLRVAHTATGGPTQFLDVRESAYGAKGDGSTDDTAAIQGAMDAAGAAGGGMVFVPPGIYKTTASLVFKYDNILIQGAGWNSIIQPVGLSSDVFNTNNGTGVYRRHIGIRDLYINATRTNQTSGHGIKLFTTRESFFQNIGIFGCHDYGVYDDGTSGFVSYDNRWDHIWISGCGGGVFGGACENDRWVEVTIQDALSGYWIMQFSGGGQYITGCNFGGAGTYSQPALVLSNSSGSRVIGNRFDHPLGSSIACNAANQIISCNEFNGTSGGAIPLLQLNAGHNVVTGNVFYDSSGTRTYSYGIVEASGQDKNLITGNQILPGASGAVSLVGAGTIEADNIKAA